MKSERTSPFSILLIIMCFLTAVASLAADDKAPLGSPDFYPSPDRPVGWRGDGSGRFPGATPPSTWSRRLVDTSTEIIVQAAKPEGEPGKDSRELDYFTVKDWLIAGPFPAPDAEKDIENDFLGAEAEAKIQPDVGAPAGNRQWKAHRAYEGSQSYRNHNENTNVHLYVDFVHAFGELVPSEPPAKFAQYTNLDNQAAYAHTYLYAPRDAEVLIDMVHALPAVKIWINGEPQRVEKGSWRRPTTIKASLQEGWNRLLVKAICDEAQLPWRSQYATPRPGVLGQTQWRFALHIRPAGPGPFSYATKNIAWMTKLTGRNASQPIVIGDKVFVGGGDADLFCLDRASGKILWMHTMTYWDAMTDEERAAVAETAAPLMKQLEQANQEIVSLINAHITPQGLDTDRQDAIDKQLDERNKLVRSVHISLATGKRGRIDDNRISAGNATPTSDGNLVYWLVQGRGGGYQTSAFDLDGKRIWSRFEYQETTTEHGPHRSPLLIDGRLLIATNEQLIAYDTANGKELWRTPVPRGGSIPGQPIVTQVNGKQALQTAHQLVSLDGEVLSDRGWAQWGPYLPVVEDGMLYNSSNRRSVYAFEALAIPIQRQSDANWTVDGRTLYGHLVDTTNIYYIGSPLYEDGLIYQVDVTGIMLAIDTRERKRAYLRFMDGYNYNHRHFYGYSSSPTLAGDKIYLMDGVGHITILKPGAEGAVLGTNVLQNLSNLPESAPNKYEGFLANMYFHGNQMFVHSDNYLYCIEENDKNQVLAADSADRRDSEGQPVHSPSISSEGKKGGSQVQIADADNRDSFGKSRTAPTATHAPKASSPRSGFRGNGSGVYPDARIPLEWSSDTKPRWKVEIGNSYGSAVISGHRVFVTAEPDILHCVNLTDGKILWTRTHGFDQLSAEEAGKARKQSTDCGYATPTPYTDGQQVWVVYGTGVVASYDMEGKRRWIRYIDHEQSNEYGRSASPVMADGKLIVTITHLVALDPETGKTLWEQPKARESYGTPAVTRIGTSEVLVTPTGYLVAASDGRVLASGMGTAANTSPVVHDGVAYFCDPETTAWKLPGTVDGKPEELWLTETIGEFFASPVVHDSILYCISNDGYLYAINTADGEVLYEEELVRGDMPMDMDDFYPSLIVANDHLLVSNSAGQTAIIKPGPKINLLRINERRPGSGSTPAIDSSNLFIRSGSHLFMHDKP